MFRILVPLDGTPQAAAALPLAQQIAHATSGEITLLRVSSERPGLHERLPFGSAQQYLSDLAGELQRDGLPVQYWVRTDDTVTAILEEICISGADLVVMATHGRSGLGRAVLGSVTEQIIAHSPVPVMTLRPGRKPVHQIKTLLVPVDETAGGALALQPAIELGQSVAARLVLLDVVEPVLLETDAAALHENEKRESAGLSAAWVYVEQLVARVRAAGVQVEGRAEFGPAAATIREIATQVDADMIVMSTRARGLLARAILGSVTDEIVRTAQCPVLVVRRGRVNAVAAALESLMEVPLRAARSTHLREMAASEPRA